MNRAIPNRQIAEEAADWAVRIDAGSLDLAERKALADWLRASPVHVDELLYSASVYGGLERVDRERTQSIDQYLAEAAPEVVPLFSGQVPPSSELPVAGPARPSVTTRRQWLALAASLLAVAVIGSVLATPRSGRMTATRGEPHRSASTSFATELGEQRSITLADGSVIFLNTSSRVDVRLSATERRIDLVQGEALFEVAKDTSRPFSVYAAGTMAQAVGTKFNVRRTPSGVRVVVMEGKVLVDSRIGRAATRGTPARTDEPRHLPADQALLVAGQQAELRSDRGQPVVAKADIVTAASWRMRQLSFDDAGLDEIVAEFNRYNRTPIVLAHPSLSRARFSGVFDANDPSSFIAFLELSTSVKVNRAQPGRIVLEPK